MTPLKTLPPEEEERLIQYWLQTGATYKELRAMFGVKDYYISKVIGHNLYTRRERVRKIQEMI